VLPTLLSSLELPIPDYVDGSVCWADHEAARRPEDAWTEERV
jgi:hypothetical protein